MPALFSQRALLPDSRKRGIVLCFFGVLLLGGLLLVRDFGVSFDEGVQRVSGQISLLYVFQKLPIGLQNKLLSPQAAALIAQKGGDRHLATYKDRDYGVVFELPVSAAEQVLRLHDERKVYLLRHTLTFLVCYAGFCAFYLIIARRFGNWRWGLLGTLLLVLSPRLFADYFYNDKDAVFLALFTIGVATAVPFIQRPRWSTALGHALACALAIDVRVMGILLPAATLAFVALRAVRGEYKQQQAVGPVALYGTILVTFVVAFWPYLWAAPLANFGAAWRMMSHFKWPGSVLYQGQIVKATMLPWHYPLVWLGLTIPLLQLGLFGVGVVSIAGRLLRRGWQLYATNEEWQDLLFLGLTVVPLLAVIGLHSVLYNGWRQLYFIYPMLLLVAVRGLVALWQWHPTASTLSRYWQPALGLAVGLSLVVIAGRMVRLHPLENLYFNALAPTPTENFYDADYWGLSYHQGLAWITQHDSRQHIRVYSSEIQPLTLNRYMQPMAERERLEIVPAAEQADYILNSYSTQFSVPYGRPRYSIRAEDVRLLDIYQLH